MTSHDLVEAEHCRSPASERRKMRESRRPTLCVIDENGCEVTHDFSTQNEPCPVNDVKIALENLALRDHNDNVKFINNGNELTIPETDKDFNELKATTARLKLSTRRQSTVTWQQEHLEKTNSDVLKSSLSITKTECEDEGFTEERKTRINEALAWLRSELLQMRCEDEVLARKLLSIRHDIQQLKLQRSCQEHEDMLEDATIEMEETNQLNEICDFPLTGGVIDTPLKQLGVTRMHLSARRFSTC